ncbi:MAG: hypothetical protein JSR82_18880 [Verrucomicrobia bacterium]|nr:hypothetical protein [Verrucomicrobiota bacterium]
MPPAPADLRADPLRTIALGGLVIGLLDGLFAITFYPALGATFEGIWRVVASGLIGARAQQGGSEIVALGLLLHFVAATGIATAFYLLVRLLPTLLRQAVPVGLLYGLLAWVGMNLLVVPLSQVPPRQKPRRGSIVLCELAGHALLVGLPVALIARWSARRRADGGWPADAAR